MRPLTSAELLSIWERGLTQSQAEKTLHLLAAASSVTDLGPIVSLSIGERDARLLQLREWMFGTRFLNMAHCPACSELVEWESELNDIRIQPFSEENDVKTFHFEMEGFQICFRLPNSQDMSLISTKELYRSNPEQLLYDCIINVKSSGNDCTARDLPSHVIRAIDQRMGEEDPQADIRMLLNCPECSHNWEAQFNISVYLWEEINQWAVHMLQEITLLAKAFGWSEHDILHMSTRRRQLYLELVS